MIMFLYIKYKFRNYDFQSLVSSTEVKIYSILEWKELSILWICSAPYTQPA